MKTTAYFIGTVGSGVTDASVGSVGSNITSYWRHYSRHWLSGIGDARKIRSFRPCRAYSRHPTQSLARERRLEERQHDRTRPLRRDVPRD